MNYVVVLDFGYPKPGYHGQSTIDDLSEIAVKRYLARPEETVVLAQDKVYANLFRRGIFATGHLLSLRVGQSSSMSVNSQGRTRAALSLAKEKIDAHDAKHRLAQMSEEKRYFAGGPQVELVAHADHVERAIRQGQKLGLSMHPAPRLPTRFYANAEQWWCRNRLAWRVRESCSGLVLKALHQI